jgi:hypothetical protein
MSTKEWFTDKKWIRDWGIVCRLMKNLKASCSFCQVYYSGNYNAISLSLAKISSFLPLLLLVRISQTVQLTVYVFTYSPMVSTWTDSNFISRLILDLSENPSIPWGRRDRGWSSTKSARSRDAHNPLTILHLSRLKSWWSFNSTSPHLIPLHLQSPSMPRCSGKVELEPVGNSLGSPIRGCIQAL